MSDLTYSPEFDQKSDRVDGFESAINLLNNAQKIEFLPSLLQNGDIFVFGDTHNDYSIPEFLISLINELKQAGIASFGFELVGNTDQNLEIIKEINNGNFSRLDQLDFSAGFGSIRNKESRQRLVKELVNAGINIYLFASWPLNSYKPSMEEEAAKVVYPHSKKGKTAILVGVQHALYSDGGHPFRKPHVADYLKKWAKNDNQNVKNIIFSGGMRQPGEYDRSPNEFLRRAQARLSLNEPRVILNPPKHDFPCEAVILLPTAEFLPPPQT